MGRLGSGNTGGGIEVGSGQSVRPGKTGPTSTGGSAASGLAAAAVDQSLRNSTSGARVSPKSGNQIFKALNAVKFSGRG